MPELRPFPGWRFVPGRAPLGAALCPPYDVISAEVAGALRRVPHNAVHLELPVGRADARFRAAAAVWRRWTAEGVVRRDPDDSFYVCEERFRFQGRSFKRLGVLGALPCGDRRVTPHEKTLPKPKAERLALLKAVRVNTSPIFGVVRAPGGRVEDALREAVRRAPDARGRTREASFRVWRVADPRWLRRLRRLLRTQEMLIADGHHRYEVGCRGGSRAVLAYLCSEADPGLLLLPTHRVVPRRALDRSALKECRMSACASATELSRRLAASRDPYAFGLFDGRFRLAEPRTGGGCRSFLSVEWIARRLLAGVDPARVLYEHDLPAAIAAARSRRAAAVLVRPLTVEQVRRATKQIGLLPPKTTYFHPKVWAGLVFRELS